MVQTFGYIERKHPIFKACGHGDVESLKKLIESGVSIHTKISGWTCLLFALSKEKL